MIENFYYIGGIIFFNKWEVYIFRKVDEDLLKLLKNGWFFYVFNFR